MTISARIIADSTHSDTGTRIITWELEYPRFIHAEFMTHRLFSRNAASSRAIPVKRAIELILENTARPTHWGKNQPGMSAKEENTALIPNEELPFAGETKTVGLLAREKLWDLARDCAIMVARAFDKAGYHKQIVNRLLEPFSHIKVVMTTTEDDNWFWLRKHPDAQPEIQRLAEAMWVEKQNSTTNMLVPGEWHVPYYGDAGFWEPYQNNSEGVMVDRHGHTLKDALAISSSCCAQVSYRRLDDSLEKAYEIYNRLVESKPVHASPFEHQATPIDLDSDVMEGVTHFDCDGMPWSGNFRHFVQHRHLIPDNTCWDYRD